MPNERTAVGTVRGTASTATTHLRRALYALVLVGFLIGWSAFWLAVAEIHYARGDLLAAAFVTGLFVVTAIGGAVEYALQWADVDLPTPDVSVPTTSN